MLRSKFVPTLATLGGAGLIIAAAYHELPGLLGLLGFLLLVDGGIRGLRRSGADRRSLGVGTGGGTGGDGWGGHHGGHHHGGFDGGGGGFDGGGGGFDGGGGGGGD